MTPHCTSNSSPSSIYVCCLESCLTSYCWGYTSLCNRLPAGLISRPRSYKRPVSEGHGTIKRYYINISLLMALSKPWNLSVVMAKQYYIIIIIIIQFCQELINNNNNKIPFYIVFEKYGIAVPEDASWKEKDSDNKILQLNAGHARIFQEVSNMLFEIADLFENARVEELVKKCERLHLNMQW